ncbi:META domain-containing protein [Leucobacter chromiireducens]|uniref:META domain-containing protein n=1 Tax=Leucobacter chromiireducens TaxID=283877 RepID=UPI000F62F1AE|nr:META domain-containing protein [Leucobacter chromiireducens]
MKTQLIRSGALLAVATATLLLAACSSTAASVAGAWGEPDTQGRPSLTFTPKDGEAGGDYGGNDGCNVLGGSYTEKDGTIDLGVMVSTMMFCEGVDTWLSQGHSAKLDGNSLVVFDESGKQIGSLPRAAK